MASILCNNYSSTSATININWRVVRSQQIFYVQIHDSWSFIVLYVRQKPPSDTLHLFFYFSLTTNRDVQVIQWNTTQTTNEIVTQIQLLIEPPSNFVTKTHAGAYLSTQWCQWLSRKVSHQLRFLIEANQFQLILFVVSTPLHSTRHNENIKSFD